MNVVQVVLYEDKSGKRYTYKVPSGYYLSKGDLVKVRNHDGREPIAVCVTDSEILSENAVDMIMQGREVCSSIIGVFSYMDFKLVEEILKASEING